MSETLLKNHLYTYIYDKANLVNVWVMIIVREVLVKNFWPIILSCMPVGSFCLKIE